MSGIDIPGIAMYGSSGQARTIGSILCTGRNGQPHCRILYYIDDMVGGRDEFLDGRPIISFNQWQELRAPVFIPLGNTAVRRQLAARVVAAEGSLANLHLPPSLHFDGVTIGLGTAICAPGYVGTGSSIADNTLIMPMCCIGHDVRVESHCTICPSCTISGFVVLEEGVYVGAGATITNGQIDKPLVIGSNATIGVGAVVTKAVPCNATVFGNPARQLRQLARLRRAKGLGGPDPSI